MNEEIKLSQNELLVREYELFTGKRGFQKSKVKLYLTDKRVIIKASASSLANITNEVVETEISSITSVNLKIQKRFNLLAFFIGAIVALITYTVLSSANLRIPLPNYVGYILCIFVGLVVGSIFRKKSATITINHTGLGGTTVSSSMLPSLRYSSSSLPSMVPNADFEVAQSELFGLICDIKEGRIQTKLNQPHNEKQDKMIA